MPLTALANGFGFGQALLSQRWVQAPGALMLALVYQAAAGWLLNRPARHEVG